jgi:hypothetical protein
MKGDRIVVSNILVVYKPRTNLDGSFVVSFDGTVVVDQAGGVKVGSTGVVQGDPIQVHRTQLAHLQKTTAGLSGNDFVSVFPVYFDQYKLVGWLPSDHVRVVAGTNPNE